LEPEAASLLCIPLDPNALSPGGRAYFLWNDGILAYAMGDVDGLSDARLQLEAMDTTATELYERSLDAFAYEVQGDREEARQRLLGLEEARGDRTLGFQTPWVLTVHRLELARWLREAGDPQQALHFLEWQKSMFNTVPRLEAGALSGALSRLEMARAWEDLGRTQEALKWYRDFLRRYDMPPPQHQPLIEEARAAVERLGGGS
jgi:tetratricopeptide (TPR) repeat protein